METLYRKYRPIDFDTVVGQDVVVKTLRNQIRSGNIAHAYLFSGTRGTGKTTIAKIFARAINCPNEKNGNPCNECSTCKSALDGANLNIVEMDAASNRGVNDIRRINEVIAYPPINDEKYKVFIIDEAHALTKEAEQAFLKILEEPPEYVVYILATTDPNKLAETILSRCQKYNFKRITIDAIVEYLKKICKEEKIEIDDDALAFIAEKSDGSMRESISKLDRCRAYAINETLTKKLVTEILGIVDDNDFKNLTTAINTGDIKTAFTIISDCIDKGKDIIQFTSDLIWHLRNLLVVKDLKEPIESLNITTSNFKKLKEESDFISKEVLIYFIEELSKTSNVMKYDENRRVILETALIRLSTPKTNFIESAVMARLDTVEEKMENGRYVSIDIEKTAKNQGSDDVKEKEKKEPEKIEEVKLSKATFEEMNKVIENWQTITSSLGKVAKTVLAEAKPVPANENEPGCLNVLVEDDNKFELLKHNDGNKKIEEELSLITQKAINKKIIFKILSLDKTNYSKNTTWSLQDAFDKIDMEIGTEE